MTEDSLGARFWSRVNKCGAIPRIGPATPCWEWLARRNSKGYGEYNIGGKSRRAHRLAWENSYDKVPTNMELDHLCRNRGCVNPDHLEPVTHAENMRRSARAQLTHCWRGHELSGFNVRYNTIGSRVCKQCHLIRTRLRRLDLTRRDLLSPAQVRMIREWGASIKPDRTPGNRGPDTISALAKRLGISRSSIHRILNGKGWKHVI